MKRIITVFLAAITVVLSLFAFTSCEKHRVSLHGYQFGKTEITTEGGKSTVRFYPDEDFGYDVADFEKVKFKFKARDPYTTNLTKYKGFAYPPENARGNPDLQYFEMHIDDQLDEEQTLFFKARGTLLPEKSDDERAKHAAPSIFWTIVIGVLMTLVCTGFTVLGLNSWEDAHGKVFVISANLLPILINIAVYNGWGISRGIIFSVCCVLTVGLTVFLARGMDL